mmetsp:Transcript_10623/g.12783  ORF Transcript_10623/g.12783 Transcript_10623/m.12783 type:complete len:390 (+) Transcript_10623:160-1329(+)
MNIIRPIRAMSLLRASQLALPGFSSSANIRGLKTLPHASAEKKSEEPLNPADLKWDSLGFDYVPTKGTVVYDTLGDGKWGEGRIQGPYVQMHLMSNVLHYGQAIFEGMKAFHQKDGSVSLFNPLENAKRLRNGCRRLGIPEISDEMFLEALSNAVIENIDYVPPYGSGGSLYMRPVVFGHGAKLGLGKAPTYTFAVLASPVGNYYSGGLKAVDACVIDAFDRAAPLGVGNVKCAGNYAADVVPASEAAANGFPIGLYLDAVNHEYIEEFSTSNFLGISADKSTYITPKSSSILPSITNIMLRQIAKDKGMKVEERPVKFSEVETFSQVAACGTAVIVTPIKSITREGRKIEIGEDFDVLMGLYQDVRDLQTGDKEDIYGWSTVVAKKAL